MHRDWNYFATWTFKHLQNCKSSGKFDYPCSVCDFELVVVAVNRVKENMDLIRAVDLTHKNEDMRLDLDSTWTCFDKTRG